MLNGLIIFIAFAVYNIKCNDSKDKIPKEDDINKYFTNFKIEEIQPSYLIYEDSNNGRLLRKDMKSNDSVENLLSKHKIEKDNSSKLITVKSREGFVDIEL